MTYEQATKLAGGEPFLISARLKVGDHFNRLSARHNTNTVRRYRVEAVLGPETGRKFAGVAQHWCAAALVEERPYSQHRDIFKNTKTL